MPPAAVAGVGLGLGALGMGVQTYQQGRTDTRNFNAQQQQYEWLRNAISGQMQQGPNQFSQQIMGLFGDNPQLQQPDAFTAETYDPANVSAPGALPGVAAPAGVQAQQIGAPTMGEGWNTGQDALMQMLRAQQGPQGPMQSSLEGLYGGTPFDATQTIEALRPLDQRIIDEQSAALRGSAGSLGERFGSSLRNDESMLRERFSQDVTGRNAGLLQAMSESSRNRQLQALGLGAQVQQQQGMFGLNAATALQQGSLAQAGLGQQAAMANQGASLQANQFNVQQMMQAALANQQGQQFGANQQMQAALANQGAQNQAGQFNANAGFATQQANANQSNLFNQMLMGGLGQAYGMQQGQSQLNAQLLGILSGQQVPQQQAGQWGQAAQGAGQLAMLMPLLQQILSRGPATPPVV